MTEHLIRTLSRRPSASLARPSAAVAFALVLAYGGGAWLQLLHALEGGTERNEPGALVHWLRDSTLVLPLIFLAVWIGVVLARRLVERFGMSSSRVLAGAALAAVVALSASLVGAVTNPIHAALFEAHHGGHELPVALHMGRDGLLALAANLPLAMIVSALLLRFEPWAAPQVTRWLVPRSRVRRLALGSATALVLVAPVAIFAGQGAQMATAALGPGAPCPQSAPVKRYQVEAIDVDITLNRFGDHDPIGKMFVLSKDVAAVRAQERSKKVSIGLEDDAIQPLVLRANQGDCVEIGFTNSASGGDYGMHVDGLSFGVASSGDEVGDNTSSAVARGQARTYRYWVPRDPELEGAHYIRPGAGNRDQVSHGLFGSLVVEPEGSTYHHPETGAPVDSGWEAIIAPGGGKKSFREGVRVYHEIGDEKYDIPDGRGGTLPMVDPHTDAYRPGSRAINYRSEPFLNRLERNPEQKSLSYNSFTFGDPATPIQRGYVGDPTKLRVVHGGSEMFHVYHMHGGGIRWRQNPKADPTFNYADTGLDKSPKTKNSPSARLDSQSFGPGESYNMEIEGGAGGVQQAVGDLLEHCHIAEHYVAGMWNFWRVFNTLQVDLKPLGDRSAPPAPVDSAGLIGRTMPDGTKIDKDNLSQWVKPQLPPAGVPRTNEADASVWDWTIDSSDPARPTYLGAREDRGPWPNLRDGVHPGGMPGDVYVGTRPKIKFNPVDGRPAYPLLRPQIGRRSPHAPNGHSGAPFLGERADQAPKGAVDPYANRKDGMCPSGSAIKRFNLNTIQVPIKVTEKGATDDTGQIFVLAKDKDAVKSGAKAAEPLALRGNVGDCIGLTLTSELEPDATRPLGKNNLHIHHLQFDPQGSDGASAGMVYDQSVLPYKQYDPTLSAAAAAGDRTIRLANVAKFRPEVWIGVGLGSEGIEIRQIESIDANASTVTLTQALGSDHAAGESAGTEFVQSRWYPDVALDNIFFHDHVDGIHGWGKGLVGQFIVEPPGSTYHDPKTGKEVDSGTIVDVRTDNPLAPGLVDGSFREMALLSIDDNPVTDSTLNLRSEPWADRLGTNPDPSLLFSSYTHGDPNTPLPRAYKGDPFVVRTINVSGNGMDTLRLNGHRFFTENRYQGADGKPEATPLDALHYGVSERFTAMLQGGAGGPTGKSGDFLYMNGIGRRFRQGAWGIMRVLPRQVSDLQPLPGTNPAGGGLTLPSRTGGRPPQASGAGDPCPSGAPQRSFQVSAVDIPGGDEGRTLGYVQSADAAAVKSGTKQPEPLTLHAAAGECIDVRLMNERVTPPPPAVGVAPPPPRVSFHVSELERDQESSGVNVGYNAEQTVAPGESRSYRFHADTAKIGSALISDMGNPDSGIHGLYGAVVVAPRGASFSDPVSGRPRDVGTQVDVKVPGSSGYRDFTSILADDDPRIGGNFTPYAPDVQNPATINYASAGERTDDASMFSSRANGDPATPILRTYAGDPMRVHFLGAPGSEQPHVFSLGGLSWKADTEIANGNEVTAQGFGPWESFDAHVIGGAGGRARSTGDFFYGDLRRPFTEAGMWGLIRVLSDPGCPIKPLDGLDCAGQESTIRDAAVAAPNPAAAPTSGPVALPASTRSGSSASPRATRPDVLRDLIVERRVGLGALAKRGLALRLIAPRDSKVLAVRLLKAPPRRGGRAVLAGEGLVRIRRGAVVSVSWKLRPGQLRRLRPGRHLLRVQAGPTRSRLGTKRLERPIVLAREAR